MYAARPDIEQRHPNHQLARIADALGCPVAAFYDDRLAPADVSARIEMMTLWDALRTEADRQAVLDHLRRVVAPDSAAQ